MNKKPADDFVLLAKQQLEIKRQRPLFFSRGDLFDDISWELLLEIFVASEERDFIQESDLIEKVTASQSIVRRWLRVFEDCGYIKILRNRKSSMISITDIAREECVSFLVTLTKQSAHSTQPL